VPTKSSSGGGRNMLDCEIPLRDCSKGVSSSKKQQAMRGHQTQKLKANGLRLGKRKASAAATAMAAEVSSGIRQPQRCNTCGCNADSGVGNAATVITPTAVHFPESDAELRVRHSGPILRC